MREALFLAKKGLLTTRPNPMVGCVITLDNKIIGRGWHQKAGEGHAEVNAIQNVFENLGSSAESALENSEMFVTLEPCLMCASAISEVHIDKLYFGAYDEKNGAIEKNKIFLKKKHTFETEIYGGIMEKDCKSLLENFFIKLRK